jgi:NitT/TauT family transport system substrate-binding protein
MSKVVLALALILAQAGNGPDVKPINVAMYGATLGSWCIYAAQSQDYFQKAGVRLGNIVVLYGDPAIVSALTSGQADVATSGVASIIPAANGQTDQIVVIGSTEGSPVSLITPASTTSPAQLVGKTIALPAHNTSNEVIGSALVDLYVGKGKWKPLYVGGASTGRLAAVAGGVAAAAYINDPPDFTELKGMHILTRFGADQKLYNNGTILSTRKWLDTNPDAAAGFMAAVARGCDFIRDPKNRAQSMQLLVKGGSMSLDAAADAYDYYVAGPFRGTTPPTDARLDVRSFANAVQLLKSTGLITNPAFDYRSVLNFSYLDRGLKMPGFSVR